MKVLVTGGAGYIGAELVYNLSQSEVVSEVVVYDNLSGGNYNLFISHRNKINNGKVNFVFGDLLDSRQLEKVLKDVEVVYHLAAIVGNPFENTDSHIYEQVNHWGTSELVSAVENNPTVKKFFYLSSTGVYGTTRDFESRDETSALNPSSFYAISKMRAEAHVERLSSKIDSIIFRCANVYGYSPSIKFKSVINRFLFDSQFNGRININGSGKQNRPFIHIEKVVSALIQCLSNPIPSGVYNLTDRNVSVLDLVDVFKEVYPELEFIFINQHLELKNLIVEESKLLNAHISLAPTDLKEEIIRFKESNFAF